MKSSPTRAGLSLVLLLYFLGVILVITLAPFRFAVPERVQVLATGDVFDVVANILLFVPLGFLYPLARPADDEWATLRVFALGFLLSAAIETVQIFEPDRYSSILDVLTNATGAALGAMLVRAATRRIRVNARLVGRLSLEIPLIGLIYLLVPLLVVASLSATDEWTRLVSLVPLGLVGARLMSSVWKGHFGPAGLLDARAMALVAAGWMVVGTFPVLLRHPLVGAGIGAFVALMTWYECSRTPGVATTDRRFEADALRSAVPYIGIYFVTIVTLPLLAGTAPWQFALGLTGAQNQIDRQMLRLLEPVAALTVLGYLLAEARGRRELSFRAVADRIGVECAAVALAIEVSRGFQPDTGASAAQFALLVAGGLLGAGIYHNQREHVRWILAHRAGQTMSRRS